MADQVLDVRTVAVVGAGVSGVAAAVHLHRAGLDVQVFERSRRAGGIWVYDDEVSTDPDYPATKPSTGDSPEYERLSRAYLRQDSPMRELGIGNVDDPDKSRTLRNSFAPPGPCYQALKNNVSTIEMEMSVQRWPEATAEFVPHHCMADYIQQSAVDNSVLDFISFNTRVNDIRKIGSKWRIQADGLLDTNGQDSLRSTEQLFDAVVIATGHYHACNVPEINGLAKWKQAFPQAVQHSKLYRSSDSFVGQNVLLIGAGVSSLDIAKDLGNTARAVYQSSRGGPYDLPSHLLPDNAARIGGLKSFDPLASGELAGDGSIPGTVTLVNGQQLCGIHRVIVCTGYHVSFPFMRSFHRDGVEDAEADELCLSTSGQQTHNLHKDIFYIPDPTLAIIGAPYHVATFTCFEFQAMAVAAVFAGRASLPSREAMRAEYVDKLRRKGAGRTFHSLKGLGNEIAYVNELVKFVNRDGVVSLMSGHTEKWHAAYLRRVERQKLLFSKNRDAQLDRRVIDMIVGC